MRQVAAVLVALVAGVALAACEDVPAEPAPQASQDTVPHTSVPDTSVPDTSVFDTSALPAGSSGTLVAARGGEMVTCEGWGRSDHESGRAADCDTVYDIGSMTKPITAAAVLKLQMQGRLRVSDPIGRHLPGVPPDKRGITLAHLLTHTAGLVDSLGGDYERLSRDDLLARAFASELRSPPGASHHYSNVGYSLLAAVIEEASGTPYETYLAEHLFAPAGMTQTGYVLPQWDPARVAVEYDAEGVAHGRPSDHPWADDGPWWNLRGNGGLLSTARDMYLWHRALEGEAVLDEPAKDALFAPRVLEEPGGGTRAAYGGVVIDSVYGRVLWHNGGNGWSYGETARIPDGGLMVFWVTNQYRSADGWNLERGGSDLTEGVLKRLLGERK